MNEEDSILVEKYLNGEKDAFQSIIDNYRRPVFTYLSLSTPDNNLASELFVETFRTVSTLLPGYNGTMPFKHWILQVATKVLKSSKKSKILPSLLTLQGNTVSKSHLYQNTQNQIMNDEDIEMLSVLTLLSFNEKAVIILNKNLSIPCDEIALILKLRKKATQKYLHSATYKGSMSPGLPKS